jgi:L-xylulokinase
MVDRGWGSTMAKALLAVDGGLTVTKAVVFAADGRELGVGEARVPQDTPRPRWVERNMDALWDACVGAIRGALDRAGVAADDIVAVATTGHGDGIYLVDDAGHPVRPAILSLDSRAHEIVERWRGEGVLDEALQLTGQHPFSASPAPLLAWMKAHESDAWTRCRWVLTCKDWLRFRLAGVFATDFTEASLSFTDVRTQRYSDAAFSLFGLEDARDKLPPVLGCMEVGGEVRREVATLTGLRTGTPVVGGLHDVDANALGTGCVKPGQLAIVAGTWSINEVVSARPATDPDWSCRNFVEPGRWMNMAYSPASATNLEWFVRELCPLETERASARGESPFAFVNHEVASVLGEPPGPVFHPFLFGSPYGDQASAAFLGLRGWHRRPHLLRALFEGVTFNHAVHVNALRSAFPVSEARLSGGGAQSELWSQMFADALGLPVLVTDAKEAGARGAAMCAGVGVGLYDSLAEAVAATVRVVRSYQPDRSGQERLAPAYDAYRAAIDALRPIWNQLD